MLTAEDRMELNVLRKHGASIRELARATGWSRNTVRRHLREGESASMRKPAPKRVEKLDPHKYDSTERVRLPVVLHANGQLSARGCAARAKAGA